MVEFKFERQDFNAKAPVRHEPNELGDIRFRQCLSNTQWYSLPPAVRARFGKRVPAGESKLYKGRITRNHMSRLGYALAQALRIIGAPLPLEKDGIDAPAIVTVTEDRGGLGQFWTRQYGRVKGFPQIIQSIKSFAGPTGLEEHIGYGIGMTLRLDVVCGVLLFKQDRYFIEAFGKRLYLPDALTPGKLLITHTDKGENRFEFGLRLEHPLFGILIDQAVEFEDMQAPRGQAL